MTLEMKIQEEREKAKKEGFEAGKLEGKLEGKREGKLETLKTLIDLQLLTLEAAAKINGVTVTEMAALLKK